MQPGTTPWDVIRWLHDSKISAVIEPHWHDGFHVSITGLFDTQESRKTFTRDEFDLIAGWLDAEARRLFPDSSYARGILEFRIADRAAQAATELKSLELLFDYTKFHIGVYLTLTASYITLATAKIQGCDAFLPKIHEFSAWVAITLFVIAGIGGGMVASNIPVSGCHSAPEYMKMRLKFWWWKTIPATAWVSIEHGAFWLGIGAAITSFALHK
jgi:hypothetical protein